MTDDLLKRLADFELAPTMAIASDEESVEVWKIVTQLVIDSYGEIERLRGEIKKANTWTNKRRQLDRGHDD